MSLSEIALLAAPILAGLGSVVVAAPRVRALQRITDDHSLIVSLFSGTLFGRQ